VKKNGAKKPWSWASKSNEPDHPMGQSVFDRWNCAENLRGENFFFSNRLLRSADGGREGVEGYVRRRRTLGVLPGLGASQSAA